MRMRAMRWTAAAVASLVLGGCGGSGANSAAVAGAGGGSATAGGAGTTAAGTTSNGGGAALVDPAAAEPDLTGLVATSAKWLLTSQSSSVVVSSALDFVDLESGMSYPANPANLPVAYGSWSPDQKWFLFSGANADSDKNLTIVRLSKNGFVPGKLIDGFEGTRGGLSFPKCDESSRFCALARGGSMTSGVEVIDTVLGKRLGHFDFPPSFSQVFAPKGLYFAYAHGDPSEVGLARVVEGGISAPTILSAGSYMPIFSSDGQQAYFGKLESGVLRQFVLDLPSTTPKELVVVATGETQSGAGSPGPSAGSVLAYVKRSDADLAFVQAFADGRPRVVLSDPAKKVRFEFGNADQSLLAIDYETSLDIVRVEPYARLPLPGKTEMDAAQYWTTGVVGNHVYHRADGQLFIASIDAAGALSDVAVSDAGEDVSVCTFYLSHQPTTKLAYRTALGNALVVVDLTASPPVVSARLTSSSADAKFYCPDFSVDEASMVATETSTAGSKTYGVKWSGNTASQPELLLNSRTPVEVHAFSY
jgi:hypothetical protein